MSTEILNEIRDILSLHTIPLLSDPRDITRSLEEHGVAIIDIPQEVDTIRQLTGTHIADTFVELEEATKLDLHTGSFATFTRELYKRPYSELQISLKSGGFLNRPPLNIPQRSAFTHSRTKTTHIPNKLNALNNIAFWSALINSNPAYAPNQWFSGETLNPRNDYTQVSEDGVKIIHRHRYTPTPLHYDGQLGGDSSVHRIQAIYSQDEGSVRLFAVPGSNHPRVRELISKYTGSDFKSGFNTLKDESNRDLHDLLISFGVAVPATGMLLFQPYVWHFEGVRKAQYPFDHTPATAIQFTQEQVADYTSTTSVFRIYCGVVTVPQSVRNDVWVLANLRLHGWAMDPFSPQNKSHPLFVNEKSTQYWKVTTSELPKFDQYRHSTLQDVLALDPKTIELLGLY